MKIEVNKNYVKFDVNTKVNKREFKATPLEFEFSEDYDDLTCKAVFSIIPKDSEDEITFYQQPIINNKCFIPYEVMSGEGVLIGVYGYSVNGEELVLRYSPEPKNLWFLEGSYYEGAETPEEILPSQFEQYTAYLNSQIERLNRINIETEELPDGVKISVTNADGVTTEAEVYNGEKGEPGERGEPGLPGTTNYEDLINKPSINGTTLEGDVSLEDIGIGNVFNIKGSVSTPEDLPSTGNSIGDVYYVASVMAGYVWIEIDNVEQWEELGEPIDISNFAKTYLLETNFNLLTSTNLSSADISTLNKAIDSYRNNENFIFMAKEVPFYTNGSYYEVNRNVPIAISEVGNNIYIDFFRNVNLQSSLSQPISFQDVATRRRITLSNVGTPANVSSASLPANPTISGSYNLLSIGNTQSYSVSSDYIPAHKKYVDDSISNTVGNINTILATLTTPSNNGGGE